MTASVRGAGQQAGRSKEGGYVAVMTAILLTVLMGLSAFAVDVGHWYLVGQQEQRAADAAAMAGVTYLPSNPTAAFAKARDYSKINGFEHLPSAVTNPTTVTTGQDGRATRLRVTVSRTVDNIFGSLLGAPTSTISRTAVADFAGPVPMGSPCNEFGNDPDQGDNRAATCSGVLGEMWANVNAPKSDKGNGDPYQGNVCASTVDGCSGSSSGPNTDYTTDGYYYTVSVKTAGMSSLTIQLFDPVWVNTGLTCETNFGSGTTEAIDAVNDIVTDPTARYLPNITGSTPFYSPYCTGDGLFAGSQAMNTQFTVRDPGSSPWDTSTFPVHAGCQKTYPGYTGSLFSVLDQHTSGTTPRTTYNKDSTGATTSPTIVDGFRRWTTLCTIANPVVGDYLIQVKTNGLGSTPALVTAFNNANASNHFAIRAYGASSGDKENISIFGREKMGVYSNKPGVTTEFHLARVPTAAAGMFLKVRLFDVGDSSTSGTIKVVSPTGGAYAGCVGVRSADAPVNLTNCSLTVSNSTHNGRWQSITVPIPAGYSCVDADTTACWVRLQYIYGSGSQPTDVTAWTASIEGDPVRLVE